MITYHVESIHPFAEEARELFQLHYNEIADKTMELDYDVGYYENMEKRGILVVHTIRNDGMLIGYHTWIVSRHPRYRGTLMANSDILFLRPDQRFGFVAYKFLKWSVADLAARGVTRLLFHMKPHLDFSKLIERMGGKFFEKTYSLTLEK